jgi:DNA-directed RNA polymerase subunit L
MGFCSKQLKKLEKKVNNFDYPLSAIIQPILLVSLTDILNKEQTIEAYDYLVAHPFTPELYLCLVVTIVSKME